MREYDDDGILKSPSQLIEHKGFVIGAMVIRTRDKKVGTITAISISAVSLKGAKSDDTFSVNMEEFITKGVWVLHNPKASLVELDLAVMGHASSTELRLHHAKAKVLLAIDRIVADNSKNWSAACAIYAKPRMLKAKKQLEPQELVLVPSTLSIGALHLQHDKINKIPKTSVVLEYSEANLNGNGIKEDIVVYLNECRHVPKDKDHDDDVNTDKNKKEAFIVPFWFVNITQDPKLANMSVSYTCGTKTGIAVPCFVNECAVKAGTELKILESNWPRFKVPKRPAPETPAAADDPTKKGKVASKA